MRNVRRNKEERGVGNREERAVESSARVGNSMYRVEVQVVIVGITAGMNSGKLWSPSGRR